MNFKHDKFYYHYPNSVFAPNKSWKYNFLLNEYLSLAIIPADDAKQLADVSNELIKVIKLTDFLIFIKAFASKYPCLININLFLDHMKNTINEPNLSPLCLHATPLGARCSNDKESNGDYCIVHNYCVQTPWYDLGLYGIHIFKDDKYLLINPKHFYIFKNEYIMAKSYNKYKRYVQLANFLYPDAHRILWTRITHTVSTYYMFGHSELDTYIQSINN